MGVARTVAVLRGLTDGRAYGMTWVPESALVALAPSGEGAGFAEGLLAVATGMQLDAVVVPAGTTWAADAVALLGAHDIAAIWAVDGVLSRAARSLGWVEALAMSASRPEALAAACAGELDDAVEEIRVGIGHGASAALVADELASDSGWLVSPDFALEALVPCYRQLAGVGDWPVAFHSDGDVRALHQSLRHAGFSAVHVAAGGQASTALGFASARSHSMVPMGGIRAQALFSEGARSTGAAAARLAAGGPCFVCDDGGMSTVEEVAAYSSAVDAARRDSG